jgi:hypothetical protein
MNGQREPLLTDVIAIFVGLGNIAVGSTQQFNAIQYPPGDVRRTPAYHSAVFAASETPETSHVLARRESRLLGRRLT